MGILRSGTALTGLLVAASCCLGSLAQAQDSGKGKKVGFVRLISLVDAGEGNTYFSMDGKNLWEPGYELGQRTGPMGYSEGRHKLKVTKKGCTPVETQLDFLDAQTQSAVAYAEPVYDDLGRVEEWRLKVATLRQHTPVEGIVATVVSFCPQKELMLTIDEVMSGRKTTHTLKQLRSQRILLSTEPVLAKFYLGETEICKVKTRRPGNYVVIIYRKDGEYAVLKYYDPKFHVAQ